MAPGPAACTKPSALGRSPPMAQLRHFPSPPAACHLPNGLECATGGMGSVAIVVHKILGRIHPFISTGVSY